MLPVQNWSTDIRTSARRDEQVGALTM
jgi:hypothetical protein